LGARVSCLHVERPGDVESGGDLDGDRLDGKHVIRAAKDIMKHL
jgi:hypothetical protein